MFGQGNLNDIRKRIENYSFCLGDKIGKGYSSTVYKGRNDITNETVGIKVIELKSLRDKVSKNLLKSQLTCLRSLNHQNLLKYIDSYQTMNNCYIVTEYCEGGDLQKELKKKIKYSENQIKHIFIQFYAGYKYFLQAGYIHRDLKPANIFLQNGHIKIADFGFVKRLSENPKESYNVGTPIYMSPQSLSSNIYTEQSDVWSIGVILYQLSHGKIPWRGYNEAEIRSNIHIRNITFQPDLISKQLESFILLCLQKNPAHRLTIKEMWSHQWMQAIRNGSNPSKIPPVTPSYLLPSVRAKQQQKIYKHIEKTEEAEKEKAPKYSTLDHLVSILNYLRFTFKIYKFVSDNKIQFKEILKKILVNELMINLEAQETMVLTGENLFKLKGWDEFRKSSKWKIYKGVVDQYSDKYRKLSTDKQNMPMTKLKPYLVDLFNKIVHLRCDESNQKLLFRNIEALDYLVSFENLKELCEKQGWCSLLQKSPINSIVESVCHVDEDNESETLGRLQKKISNLF